MERETTKFDDWPLELGHHLIGAETQKIRVFICSCRMYFSFSIQGLEGYKEKPIHIKLEDNHLIFQRPSRLNVFERIDVQARC